jgi:hypothetical protein
LNRTLDSIERIGANCFLRGQLDLLVALTKCVRQAQGEDEHEKENPPHESRPAPIVMLIFSGSITIGNRTGRVTG